MATSNGLEVAGQGVPGRQLGDPEEEIWALPGATTLIFHSVYPGSRMYWTGSKAIAVPLIRGACQT